MSFTSCVNVSLWDAGNCAFIYFIFPQIRGLHEKHIILFLHAAQMLDICPFITLKLALFWQCMCVLDRNQRKASCTSTSAAVNVCLHLRTPAGLYQCTQENWKRAQMKVKVCVFFCRTGTLCSMTKTRKPYFFLCRLVRCAGCGIESCGAAGEQSRD